jgi:hypothetical protein
VLEFHGYEPFLNTASRWFAIITMGIFALLVKTFERFLAAIV